MLTERLGKGGRVCEPARTGQLRCPLIVRPSSEDVVTGELFGKLRALNPRWWLPDSLNMAIGASRFRQQVFRRLRIELWRNRPPYPRELLPWEEGSTQVDVSISWENPPTTVYVEMKYLAALSQKTSNGEGQKYPSDQLIRNVRVGLLECGWFRPTSLVDVPPRRFLMVVVSRGGRHRLVEQYREPETLMAAIPFSKQLRGLPMRPFIGELSYSQIARLLRGNRRWLCRCERILADDLSDYLTFKVRQGQGRVDERQSEIPWEKTA